MNTNNIDDIYPLSPLQEGLLFDTLFDPESGSYFQHLKFKFKSSFNPDAWIQACEWLIQRHACLRTGFIWESDQRPLQVVRKKVKLPWILEDWRKYSLSDQQQLLNEFLENDRKKGFNLANAPFLRISMFRIGDDAYEVICSNHHLILDGWSTAIIIKELLLFYKAAISCKQPEGENPRPYRDYIAWLLKRDLSKAEEFWRDYLKDLSSPTRLPIFFNSTTQSNNKYSYEKRRLLIDATLTSKLRTLAKQNEITLNTLIVGAWSWLLKLFCGGNDVVIGITVSGRPSSLDGVESMVGVFINTLPLRVCFQPEVDVRTWLKNLQWNLLELFEYDYCSLTKIQEWSQVPRSAPLFDSLVVFENYPINVSNEELKVIPGLSEISSGDSGSLPLSLIVAPGQETLLLMDYDHSRYDSQMIDHLLGQFQILLESIVENPHRLLSDLPMNFKANKITPIKSESNKNKISDAILHDLIEKQITVAPDRIVAVYKNEQISGWELNNRANNLAGYIHSFGIGPETFVGICVDRSIDMVVCLFGILKAGAAYIPLDPTFPAERLNFILQDSQISLLITQDCFLNKFVGFQSPTLCIDKNPETVFSHKAIGLKNIIKADNPAYVIYTSGSTGKPKGVTISHRAISHTLFERFTSFSINEDDHILQNISMEFDPSVWQMFGSLLAGARLILMPSIDQKDPGKLVDCIIKEQITITDFVPTMLRAFLEERNVSECKSLTRVFCGGEVLEGELVRKFFDNSHSILFNMYGPTEASIDASFWRCRRDENSGNAPIGQAFSEKPIYILNEYIQITPIGALGEMYIGGNGLLARCYLNGADLTAEKFIPDPFNPEVGSRMYRTGDLARVLLDNNIEFVGRNDALIKLRGYRIELSEIESVIAAHPMVKQAAVIMDDNGAGHKDLIACIVINKKTVTSQEIRSFIKAQLPEYMIPSHFIFLSSLPLLPNGKVNRAGLSMSEFRVEKSDTLQQGGGYPQDQIEELLQGIWAKILHRDTIEVTGNFFEMGGHSLSAVRLVAAIRGAFKIEIPLRAIFENPSIRTLSAVIQSLIKSGKVSGIPLILRIPRKDYAPMSFAQQRLWFLDRLTPNNAFYNVPEAYKLIGQFHHDAFVSSIKEIIRRHEILRTRFQMRDGVTVQIICSDVTPNIKNIDLTHSTVEKREREANKIVEEEAKCPFDLEHDFPMRVTLIKLTDELHWFLLTLHHIAFDGHSLIIFLEELSSVYKSKLEGKNIHLPSPVVQYADYAHWQQEFLQGEVLENELSYWKAQLDKAPATSDIPTDRTRPKIQLNKGNTLTFRIPRDQANSLKELSQTESATMFMTFLAAFIVLLSRYSDQRDFVIGTPITGRNGSETEGLIGLFVNTLVLRFVLNGEPTFRNLISQIRNVTLSAFAHKELPFEKLIEELQPQRDMSRSPLFQIMFSYQHSEKITLNFPGLKYESIRAASNTSKFDIDLTIIETENDFYAAIEFDTDLFNVETIERIKEHYLNLLESIVVNPDCRISQLNLLSKPELEKLLIEFNDTQKEYPLNLTFNQLFEEQVKRTPDTVIVSDGENQLTYQELNLAANRFSNILASQNDVGESVSGVLAMRSVNFLAIIIGILKADKVYLPIDPKLPEERIARIIEQSRLSTLIVSEAYFNKAVKSLDLLQLTPPPDIKIQETYIYSDDKEFYRNKHQSSENNLSYIIYTSGSTGIPKGAMIDHAGLINHLYVMIDEFKLNNSDVIAQTASQSFDISIWQFLTLALVGGRIEIFSDESIQDPVQLSMELVLRQITIIELVPSLISALIDRMIIDDTMSGNLNSLRLMIPTGEALTNVLCKNWYEYAPGIPLVNAYGPTECSDDVSFYYIDQRISDDLNVIPIGKPVANMQMHVLDQNMMPVPVNLIGEIYIGGVGVGRGYLNDQSMTAMAFLPDPFSDRPGMRLYKTGDIASRMFDGNLVFHGRSDHQVKIRGYRIEPSEIETILCRHPVVKEAIVTTVAVDGKQEQLIAYIRSDEKQNITIQTLRSYLKDHLPNYMIPNHFIFLDSFPLTSHGKIDRNALPDLDDSILREEGSYVPPRDEFEQIIVTIWEKLLEVAPVGINDNFFDLGGHSLSALRMIATVQKRFGKSLPLALLFEEGTVKQLAEALRGEFSPEENSPLVALQPNGNRPPLFFVHVGSGHVLCYFNLARSLGDDQPFYGIQDPHLFADGRPFESIEEMATYYIEAIRSIQPNGPYFIGGWSFGGLIAFEMAKQLKQHGEIIAQLILLDTGTPDLVREFADGKDDAALLAVLAQEMYLPITADDIRKFDISDQIQFVAQKMKEANIIFEDAQSYLKRGLEVFKGRLKAVDSYNPVPYQGRITLFAANVLEPEERLRHTLDEHLQELTSGWESISNEPVDLVLIPGRHHEIAREPNVHTLAQSLRANMDKILRNNSQIEVRI